MEEKNLLKEITYLSRLIGQHKSKLKLRNIALPHLSQKTENKIKSGDRNLQTIPVQNLKTVSSSHYKVNSVLPQRAQKQSPRSTEVNIAKVEQKDHLKKSGARTNVDFLSLDTTQQVKNSESLSFEVPKNSAGISSVHINPNFFTTARNSRQEIATVRCKSVHINPRLLGAVTTDVNPGGYNKESMHSHPVALPNYHLTSFSQTETLQSSISNKTSNVCILKPQSTMISTQISTEKSTNLSVPLRTVTPRKKYIYQSKMKLVKSVVNTPTDCKTAKTIKTPHGGTLLAVSRTKLVRLPGKARRLNSKSDSISSSTITKSRYRLRRSSTTTPSSPLLRSARKVCSKYRSAAVVTMLGASSKYSLDHRIVKPLRKGRPSSCRSQFKVDNRSSAASSTPSRAFRVHSHLLISPMRRSTCNRTWTSGVTPRLVQKVAISHKKLSRIGCIPGSRSYLQNSALVRIGGLLYKSSRTKLTLSKALDKKADTTVKIRTVVKRQNLNAGHIVYVRGNKFVMDRSGKTLKRMTDITGASSLSQDKRRTRVSRVDIGGYTYVQKSPSVLVRTNIHTARNVVSNAKQRSIAFLAQKMRKINTPCLFYRRFGRCPRQEKGRCELVHDPKYIDICKKFLQGKCTLDGCLLSHNVGPEKMPTCRFFLEGCCVRDLCPYLHVKVNDRAPICRNFLQGYCADGPECLKRHIMLCPEFDKNGSCTKGKYCPYPHSTAPRVQRAICSDPPVMSSEKNCEYKSNSPAPTKRKRYYETDSGEQNEDELHSPPMRKRYFETEAANVFEVSHHVQSDVDLSGDDLDQSTAESPGSAARRRPKIGDLPSFIALESFESD